MPEAKVESLLNFTIKNLQLANLKVEELFAKYNVPFTSVSNDNVPNHVWANWSLILIAVLSLLFTGSRILQRSYFGRVFTSIYHATLLFLSLQFCLMAYYYNNSKDSPDFKVSWIENIPRIEFKQVFFHYTLCILLACKFLSSCLKIASGKSLRSTDLYNLFGANVWIYLSFTEPSSFIKAAFMELSFLTVYHFHSLIRSLGFKRISNSIYPCVYALQLIEFIRFTASNISVFYQNYASISSYHFWFNQLMIVVHIVGILNTFKGIVSTYTTSFRNSMTTFLLGFHAFALVGLVLIFMHKNYLRLIIEVFTFYVITGLGITCGAHRLWAHRSYKAHWSFRLFLMLLNSFANQGTIFHWSRDHRVHHKYSEQESDPHNATRGFFYSHMGWLLLKKPDAVREAGKEIDCSDLLQDPIVAFQKRYDPFWNQSFCFLLPALYGHYVYGSFWLGFFVHGCLRWIICLHATWTVNSVAHMWGDRPYNPNINPAESFFTALFANGEGWHNWHHEYPYDYATSEGGAFTHYNPSKILIDLAARFNLVYDRKRALTVWHKVQARRLIEDKKKAEDVAEKLKRNPSISKLPNLKGSLPPQFVQKSIVLSSISVIRDFGLCFCLAAFAWFMHHYSIYLLPVAWYKTNYLITVLCWSVYAILQGTVAIGLWVLGYEAAGARYCNSRILNHIVGASLHSILLIPYKPRRRHKEKEREKASLAICLSDSQFGIIKLQLADLTTFGGIILMVFVSFFILCIKYAGVGNFCHLYVGPWIVLNSWLMLYEWILDNGPQDCFELDLSESNWQLFTGDFLLRSWPKRFRGRRYLWTRLVDHLHHHLSLSHIVQAVEFDVPHYRVNEAFKRLGDLLENVSSEVMDAKKHIVRNIKKNPATPIS